MSVAATHQETPPHAPEAGWIRRFLGPLYFTGVFWFRFHRWGVRILPNWGMSLLMPLFTTFFWLTLVNIRRAIGWNLDAVLGPCGWWERQLRALRTIRLFSWCLSERYERLSTDRTFSIEIEGPETWREVTAAGQGVILVTAHLGAWEVGSMLPASREMRQVHVVREAETDPRAQRFFANLIRQGGGDYYTTHFAEDPQLGMILLDALRRGEIVALQGDRPRAGGRTAEMKLFGRPYPMPIGPVALARAAGTPIVPVFVMRTGRLSYRCLVRPPIPVAHTASRQRDMEEALQRFVDELEGAIRQQPHQWFCFRRLWKGEEERRVSTAATPTAATPAVDSPPPATP